MNDNYVAIIDDDDSLRDALVGLVRSFGHKVQGFCSAEEYLSSKFVSNSVCIVSDIHMPGMSGMELIQNLSDCASRIPVILITARDEVGLEKRAIAQGAACFLRKPFEVDKLMSCIDRAVSIDPKFVDDSL
jgi:FixJ family two-component response regulator